jgi:hypothetical protein
MIQMFDVLRLAPMTGHCPDCAAESGTGEPGTVPDLRDRAA